MADRNRAVVAVTGAGGLVGATVVRMLGESGFARRANMMHRMRS
jgi:hypothetical protein